MIISSIIKLAPLSGIIATILIVVGMLLARPFDYFPTAERAQEYYSETADRIQSRAVLAGFLAVIFMLWFAGTVHQAMLDTEGLTRHLATVSFGGGVLIAISIALANGLLWVAAGRAGRPEGISPETAMIFYDLSQTVLSNMLSIGLAIFIGATGLGSLQTQLFPAWLGWTSVVFFIGLLTTYHYIFEGLAFIWIVIVSILLL